MKISDLGVSESYASDFSRPKHATAKDKSVEPSNPLFLFFEIYAEDSNLLCKKWGWKKLKMHAKKCVKAKDRKLPKLKSLPEMKEALRNYFASIKTYARFYGDYVTLVGKKNRFSFQVLLSSSLTGPEKYDVVTAICNKILQNKVPLHEPGQVFNFHELLHHTQWIPIRKLLNYKADVNYD